MSRLYDNFESIIEGILLCLMIWVIGLVALVAWPAREIYDSWGVDDDADY